MSKVIWIVCKDVMPVEWLGMVSFPIRTFLTEEAADRFAIEQNPTHPKGFEYTCPSEGYKEFHAYFVEPIILEEE